MLHNSLSFFIFIIISTSFIVKIIPSTSAEVQNSIVPMSIDNQPVSGMWFFTFELSISA